jgi:hypothetical protein
MKNLFLNPNDLAGPAAVLGAMSKEAAGALQSLVPGVPDMAATLDKYYGRGKWFLFWDEDASGKPVRGTISLAFGKKTLVIG